MFKGIPIIGIVGGVGSGKSHVARVFGQFGCCVINSDEQVTQAYALPEVRRAVMQRWGDQAFLPDGTINRKHLASKVFASADERHHLEQIVHPAVAMLRDKVMEEAAASERPPVAFVWDTPLLFEAGIAGHCDAVVFVDAPESVRLRRVRENRGWSDNELSRRENSQWPLDKKRALSHYVVSNAAEMAGSTPATPVPADATEPKPLDSAAVGDVGSKPERLQGSLPAQVESVLSRVVDDVRNGRGTDGTDRAVGLQSNRVG